MSRETPLVLLPGLLCTKALWRHQVETLREIAMVQIADLTQEDSITGMAASVLENSPDRFALAGLSMGGYTALEIMRQAPERITRLALLDTSARADSPDRTEIRRAQIALVQEGRFEEVIDQFVQMMINPEMPPDEEFQEAIRSMCRTVGPDIYIRQQTAIMHRRDSRGDLAGIDCPTLVLCGRQDRSTPLELHEELASGISGARLVVVEDCGHLTSMEKPEAVSTAMREWLQS